MYVIDNLIDKIEAFNEKNDLQHGNSETYYEADRGILTTIEGKNHTTLTIEISLDDIYETERNKNVLEVIKRNYQAIINDFDVDTEFTELWSQDFADKNGFTPQIFINILEDDANQFDNIQYS
ncbi:hypothetical protein [Staphylococcus aureus]|uniref:hypothetical protein n=1 Tax=Staphylococcus aureus TaxID=1280 RepID=UPI0004514D1A|nr:hypothetical protein [Staphylococcus aureus]EWJ88123.1 hypothetical protein U607_02724 [Staphylococcus aureus F36687]EWT80289.1 hypothetical protein V330_02775 [Staphylococcus aureus F85609]EWV01727.1 hypothetical protein U621_02859 [Staphylococcus aureus F53393]NKP41917.1 hypothetical protein [Staphylococcus aureus]NKP83787.1 hypothetical protein [Staphylococcus aureus]